MNNKHMMKCWLWKILWGIGALTLLFALISLFRTQLFDLTAPGWFWVALVFGVLSIPIKLDCLSCGVCGIDKKGHTM